MSEQMRFYKISPQLVLLSVIGRRNLHSDANAHLQYFQKQYANHINYPMCTIRYRSDVIPFSFEMLVNPLAMSDGELMTNFKLELTQFSQNNSLTDVSVLQFTWENLIAESLRLSCVTDRESNLAILF